MDLEVEVWRGRIAGGPDPADDLSGDDLRADGEIRRERRQVRVEVVRAIGGGQPPRVAGERARLVDGLLGERAVGDRVDELPGLRDQVDTFVPASTGAHRHPRVGVPARPLDGEGREGDHGGHGRRRGIARRRGRRGRRRGDRAIGKAQRVAGVERRRCGRAVGGQERRRGDRDLLRDAEPVVPRHDRVGVRRGARELVLGDPAHGRRTGVPVGQPRRRDDEREGGGEPDGSTRSPGAASPAGRWHWIEQARVVARHERPLPPAPHVTVSDSRGRVMSPACDDPAHVQCPRHRHGAPVGGS